MRFLLIVLMLIARINCAYASSSKVEDEKALLGCGSVTSKILEEYDMNQWGEGWKFNGTYADPKNTKYHSHLGWVTVCNEKELNPDVEVDLLDKVARRKLFTKDRFKLIVDESCSNFFRTEELTHDSFFSLKKGGAYLFPIRIVWETEEALPYVYKLRPPSMKGTTHRLEDDMLYLPGNVEKQYKKASEYWCGALKKIGFSEVALYTSPKYLALEEMAKQENVTGRKIYENFKKSLSTLSSQDLERKVTTFLSKQRLIAEKYAKKTPALELDSIFLKANILGDGFYVIAKK